jgi:ubiquitin carboxyl-terminal hydrolase 36/42
VYPKDPSNSGKPYVFNTRRKAKQTYRTGDKSLLEEADLPQNQLKHAKKPKVTSESMDDILYPESARKHPQETDQKREKSMPQNIETAHSDDKEGGRLSGLSVDDAVRDKVGCRPRSNSTDGELNLPRRGLCDERIVLEAHRWKNPMGRAAPKGFTNLGNTCFLNATLQCLAYLPTFSQTLTSLPLKNGLKMSKGQRISTTLCSLFRQVHGVDGLRSDRAALSPGGIVKALPSLDTGGQRSGYKFRPGRQEDAHEFLVHLLDAMHDGELKAAGKDVDEEFATWFYIQS